MTVQVPAGFPAGTLINERYKVEKELGRGGFGRTYLVHDTHRFDAPCVLKELIPPQGCDDSAIRKAKELFQREASVLHKIDHPQIPKLLAYVESEEKLLLVEELVVGQTYFDILRDRTKQKQTFSELEILKLLAGLLPILQYLHSKNLVHRDISPDNIMLSQETGKPVLIDFGLVKPMLKDIQLQQASALMGKQGFSPPEQLSYGQCSPASDIYALGVTLIVLLTGRLPMNLLNPGVVGLDWKTHVKVRAETAQILDRMIEPLIRERYQTAVEIQQDLQVLRRKLSVKRPPAPSQAVTAQPQFQQSAQKKVPVRKSVPQKQGAASTFEPNFLSLCREVLACHVGPMASFLLEEKLAQQPQGSPVRLIEALADEIPDPDSAAKFRKKLLQSSVKLTQGESVDAETESSPLQPSLFPTSQLPRIVLSRADLEALVYQMRAKGGLEIKDRRHNLKLYPNCFVGQDAVSWLKNLRSIDTESAVYVYQQLIEMKVIHHVTDSHGFKNEKLFYRFYIDENREQ